MGALYEDVETFFGDIFACYGRAVSRYPHPFTIFPLVLCLLLGLGLFSIKYETNIENLYSPINSQAQKDREQILALFNPLKLLANKNQPKNQNPSHSSAWQTDFKYHQKIYQPTYFEIIVFNKNKPSKDLNSNKKIQAKINQNVQTNDSSADSNQSTSASNMSLPTSGKSEFRCPWKSESQLSKLQEEVLTDDESNPTLSYLTPKAIEAIRTLYRCIATFRSPKTSSYAYFDICLKFNNRCSVDVFVMKNVSANTCAYFSSHSRTTKQTFSNKTLHNKSSKSPFSDSKTIKSIVKHGSTTYPSTPSLQTSVIYSLHNNFSNETLQKIPPKSSKKTTSRTKLPHLQISPTSKAIKIRFNLKGETRGEERQRHLRWQEAMMEQMKRYKNPHIEATFVTSDSLEIELQDHVGGDTKYFVLSVVAMLVSATFAGSGGSADHVVLAYTGVVAALLTILGTFGLLSLIGTSFVNLCSVMPFLVLGVGVDDMLQLLVEWRKTVSQQKRLSKTLRMAAVSITITSLTDLLVFCIGATSPFLSVRNFCACSGVGIFLCYLNQLTFFSGCIVLISRHCKCQKTKKSFTKSNPNIQPLLNPQNFTTTTFIDIENSPNPKANTSTPTNRGYELVSSEDKPQETANKNEYQLQEIPVYDGTKLRPSNFKVVAVHNLNDHDTDRLDVEQATTSHASTSKNRRGSAESFRTVVANAITSKEGASESTTPTPQKQFQKNDSGIEIHYEDRGSKQGTDKLSCSKYCLCIESFLRLKQQKDQKEGTFGVCELFVYSFSKYYPRILLHWIGKTITVFIFLAYVVFSIRGVTKLEEGLNLEDLVPPEHYYKYHEKIDSKLFPNCGIVVTFVIYKPITYHKPQTREKLQTFLDNIESSEFIVPGSSIAWFNAYSSFLSERPRKKSETVEWGKRLKKEFLPKNPHFMGDISFSKRANNMWIVDASRFYFVCKRTNTSEDQKDLMLALRAMAANSTLPVKAFSPQFVFFEHYASILKNTLLPVGVTIIGMLFVALVFIPHPIAVLCVIGSMGSTVVGMMGFMHLCGLALSAITTMQIILGVGVCVSYTVRTSHAFMTATGKSRNERVTSALVKVGASILTGACCSFLSAFSLYYGSSFIFVSFFKTTAFALFLGVLHSIVFLPVMLSFVGPKRTGKPRLFIPAHAAISNTVNNPSVISPPNEARTSLRSYSESSSSLKEQQTSPSSKTYHSKVARIKSCDLPTRMSSSCHNDDSSFGKGELLGKAFKENKVSFKLNENNKKMKYSRKNDSNLREPNEKCNDE